MPTPAPSQKQCVQDRFGPAASHYATASVHRQGKDLDAMLPAAALCGSERVLDVGCGAGHTAIAFAPHVERVDALDLTEAMLEQTRMAAKAAGLTNLQTMRGDVEAIPFADADFDLVTCRLCAHHFRSPARALGEIMRVLRPGGRLLLVDIVSPETGVEDTFLNAVELLRDPSHVRDWRLSEWLAMFGAAGFAAEVLTTWPLHLEFDSWVARIGATPAAVRGLETVFDAATREVRDHFAIEPSRSFRITNALLRGRLTS
ncbi:MAG: class I SAM-dependent methyltransferase [Deltaproteobacteria bacterium]|nr:class I SAM-dependent methyltransferase [Deltaproteobacteria bacterium]MBW2697036.1 class I SAM-dependent methyltransferase [Deltaproteobacteria bacterium]